MPALPRSVAVRSTLLLLFMAAAPMARAQVCEGPITLSSQAQVDAFDCAEVTSDLTVSGSDVVNLDGLAALTAVGGYLHIFVSRELTDLTGLSGLTSVGRTLAISGNDALTDLTGLDGITSLGGNLRISDNDALTHLDALASISSVGGDLRIESNDALTDLAGLGGIASIGGTSSLTLMRRSPTSRDSAGPPRSGAISPS